MSPDGWSIWTGTRKQYPKWETEEETVASLVKGGMVKGTGRHIFTECMSMVIRDARAHV